MSFDLRNIVHFDAAEGQIPEGEVSAYGVANSHANCVPASFCAALDFAGLEDVDPQRITNDVYGSGYRGGEGFEPVIAWIEANVHGAPTFTVAAFDFDKLEAAGQANRLVVVAGWVDGPSVRFGSFKEQGLGHASLIAAHSESDVFTVWNTWTGEMQDYSRDEINASMYAMAVMELDLNTRVHPLASAQSFKLNAAISVWNMLLNAPSPAVRWPGETVIATGEAAVNGVDYWVDHRDGDAYGYRKADVAASIAAPPPPPPTPPAAPAPIPAPPPAAPAPVAPPTRPAPQPSWGDVFRAFLAMIASWFGRKK